jgi:NAD(P)-dependent dehydrogenase (short-subunit alcohol dehydrogenase family)
MVPLPTIEAASLKELEGKICVITGATSGIGQIAAERLAAIGVRVILIARDKARGEAALQRLRERGPGPAHGVYYADLMRIPEVKRVAAEIAATESRLDVLINNAGAMFGFRRVTAEGLEQHFALNHMAYFVLSHGLRELLFAAAPARVVNTASAAHQGARLDFADLQLARGYDAVSAYARSKLCNILFTRALARRWADAGVTVNCLHPGFVATRFGRETGGLLSLVLRTAQLFAISPEEGAETIVYLAASPEVCHITGAYFVNCRRVAPALQAEDDAAAERLWQVSARLAVIE